MTIAELTHAGQTLFGRRWVYDLARALGPLHPGGPREIDPGTVYKWRDGKRPMPDWVEGAIAKIAWRKLAQWERIRQGLAEVEAVQEVT